MKSAGKDSDAVPASSADPIDDDAIFHRLKLSKWFATTFFSLQTIFFGSYCM